MKRRTPIWIAVNKRGVVRAIWYNGWWQPFKRWRKAVKSIGLTAVRATLLRER